MTGRDTMIEKKLEVAMLYDIYHPLLTDTQKNIMDLYYNHDLSLTEIAEEVGVSRQAVYDHLKRTEKLLCDYEEKLKIREGESRRSRLIKEATSNLESLKENRETIIKIKEILEQL